MRNLPRCQDLPPPWPLTITYTDDGYHKPLLEAAPIFLLGEVESPGQVRPTLHKFSPRFVQFFAAFWLQVLACRRQSRANPGRALLKRNGTNPSWGSGGKYEHWLVGPTASALFFHIRASHVYSVLGGVVFRACSGAISAQGLVIVALPGGRGH